MPIRHRSIKNVRRDHLKGFIDRRLVEAVGHPVREHILAVLNERVASPTEIGDELELDVTAFFKHVQTLERLGFIECVGTRRSRGGIERFYRATATLFFDDESWNCVPATVRADVCAYLLRTIAEASGGALAAGKLGTGKAEHLSWSPGVVDARGRKEAMEILEDALARLERVQEESSTRLRETEEPGVPMGFAMLGFETEGPPRKERRKAAKRSPAPAPARKRRRTSSR